VETRAHASRVYKKVTRQWWLSFNVKCQVVESTPGLDCPNGAVIYLMAPGLLQGAAVAALGGNFPDAVRIRRIEGNVYFKPSNSLLAVGGGGTDCFDAVVAQANHNVFMRMGLKKVDAPQGTSGVAPAWNPLNNGATPFELSDYTEGRWLKMWEHVWGSRGGVTAVKANAFSCCTEQASYTVPPTASGSNPGYIVPAAVCVPCGDVEDPAVNNACQFEALSHDWWKARIHYGRPLVMKEADSLALFFGWERMQDTTDVARLDQPSMKWFGGVRMLLES
jgi:hypothetical protein